MSEQDDRTDGVAFAAAVQPVAAEAADIAAVAVDSFVVVESQLEGWTGYAKILPEQIFADQALRDQILSGSHGSVFIDAFNANVARYLSPGQPIVLALGEAADEDEALRYWPAVVTKLTATADSAGRLFCHIHFSDTVTYLADRPVWGVFRDCTLGEAVGGAIALVQNGAGGPTLTPSCAPLPAVALTEHLREPLDVLPFVAATGQTLGVWLAQVLGRLGVRMEMFGMADGTIAAELKDGPPSDIADEFTFASSPSATGAVLRSTVMGPGGVERDAVLDNPSAGEVRRMLDAGSVGTLVTAAGTGIEEAAYRGRLSEGTADMAMVEARVVTSAASIFAGGRLRFDRPVNGTDAWQVVVAQHGYADGRYFNTAFLSKDGAAWRPRRPRNTDGPSLVTGVVSDGASAPGDLVARDRLGRIPVALHAEVAGREEVGQRTGAGIAGLPLPVADPVAGGMHGFLPEHRQGDRCRLAVNSPFDIEVIGFLYDDHRRIAADVADGSAGIVVDHRPEAWSGVLFRPDADDGKDDAAQL